MQRLNIAKRQLKSFLSDVLILRGVQPHQVVACAKIIEALALVEEAELHMAHVAMDVPPAIASRLKQLE